MSDTALLAEQAIKKALNGQWAKAKKLNLEILKENPKSLHALLRLAKSYLNLNQISQAKKTYRQVLFLDKYNPIAKRNLARLKRVKKRDTSKNPLNTNSLFLEEPGKTKTASLVRLTDEEKLASLEIGEPVDLIVNPKSISVKGKNNEYLGRLPDDLAYRLIHFIKRGNRYQSFIQSVEENKLQIFIKEVKKSKQNQHTPSFPPQSGKKGYYSFLPTQALDQSPLLMDNEG